MFDYILDCDGCGNAIEPSEKSYCHDCVEALRTIEELNQMVKNIRESKEDKS